MSDHPLDREDGVDRADLVESTPQRRRVTRTGWLVTGGGLLVTLACTIAGGEAAQRWMVTGLAKLTTLSGLVIAAFGYRGTRLGRPLASMPARNAAPTVVQGRASSEFESHLVVVAIWILVALVLPINFMLTAFVSRWLNTGNNMEFEAAVMFTLLGAFQSEAGLVGLWAILGRQAAAYRLPQAGLVLFLVWTSWATAVGMQGGVPGPLLILVGAILLLSATIAFLTCWLGARMFPHLAPKRRDPVETQYSIRTIMSWMVFVAAASAVLRFVFSANLGLSWPVGGPSSWQLVLTGVGLRGLWRRHGGGRVVDGSLQSRGETPPLVRLCIFGGAHDVGDWLSVSAWAVQFPGLEIRRGYSLLRWRAFHADGRDSRDHSFLR